MRDNRNEREMAVVTGTTGSMWEPLAKHLDDISITFSCGNSANGWLVMRACTAKCSVVRHITWFAFWAASYKAGMLCVHGTVSPLVNL
jgi:hypothetical protein